MENVSVHTKAVGNVCVITIDNPPVNASSVAVRQGLMSAIETLASNSEFKAGVLIGAGNTFVAGSDIREFGKPLEGPLLPDVIRAIEHCSKPVVAALHGAALGGGFELALGCDARVADKDAVVGLPEVSLGIIPGAGGTQRLPRRVGIAKAIKMICGAQRIGAIEANALNLIDEVVNGDLLNSAIEYAGRMNGQKRRIRDEVVPKEDVSLILKASEDAMRSGKKRPAVKSAIEVIRASEALPFEDALADERAVFMHCDSSQMHLHFDTYSSRSETVRNCRMNCWQIPSQ